jgi:hypothetical protein
MRRVVPASTFLVTWQEISRNPLLAIPQIVGKHWQIDRLLPTIICCVFESNNWPELINWQIFKTQGRLYIKQFARKICFFEIRLFKGWGCETNYVTVRISRS